ncbi:MAG: arginine--tRNA ligase [Anaerolineae bacterium]|nr:arginine--tRNA ligase [Anaerolineae bacterium]
MFEKEQYLIQQQIVSILKQNGLPEEPLKWTWIPFSGHWGIATSMFGTASAEAKSGKKVNVKERAAEIAVLVREKIELPSEFEKIEAVNGYVNLYFNSDTFARRAVDVVLEQGKDFGQGEPNGRTVMVEYSQPNTHKAFHVGHLRNMVLGSSICDIIEFAGSKVIRANYIGDIGLHVIKWLWNYMTYHNGEIPPREGMTHWMGGLYAEAVKRLEENPDLDEQVRALFKRWDARDPEIVALWKKTRQWSLDAFDQVYSLLGIRFERIYFESDVEDSGKDIVAGLIEKGLAKDERPEGAVIVDLDSIMGTKEKYRVLVILRSDGTSLYSTKDLSLAIQKFDEYALDQSVYVIDVRQSLYMQQIFKVMELMGYSWAKNCYHLAYEIVNLPGNVTIASREGTVVLLEDLITEAEKRARVIVEEKNPDLADDLKAVIARSVAIGAIKYSLLNRDNTKIITFDWNAAMDVNGQAAPYIQYAAVRANSILRKVQFSIPESTHVGYTLSKDEVELVDYLTRFPQEVQRAAKDMRPLLIANYAFELAKVFSNFYNNCPVLTAEGSTRNFRLRMVAAARQVIANSLSLLGIEVPEVM